MDDSKHDLFADLYVRNQARLYRYIVSLVPNRADADELFQETNLTLWKIWDRYDPQLAFLPWAFGVAQNQVRNFLRGRYNRPHLLSEELLADLALLQQTENAYLSSRQEALTNCLEDLPRPKKELLGRCYGQVESMKTIAQSTGQTPEAIYKAVQRLRDALFECVNKRLALESEG